MPGAISTQQNNNDATTSGPLRGIYHLTHPRSASNLFQNMMAKQPGFQYSGYKLFDAGFGLLAQLEKGPLSGWPEEERKKMYEAFEKGFETMQDEIEEAERNGKKILLKEHTRFLYAPDKLMRCIYKDDTVEPCIIHERGAPTDTPHTNPTSVPDSFLLQFQPIFQIRNPVLMFPSLVRAQMDVNFVSRPRDIVCQLMLNLHAPRAVYDWYAEQSATSHVIPRVIDADDVMNDPATMRLLCTQTGLDPDAVVYEWEERVVENPMQARFLSTLAKSKGIVKGLDAQGKTVESEMEKWVAEWGREDAEEMARLVRDAMPDYEYLYSKRTKAGGKSVRE